MGTSLMHTCTHLSETDETNKWRFKKSTGISFNPNKCMYLVGLLLLFKNISTFCNSATNSLQPNGVSGKVNVRSVTGEFQYLGKFF